MDAKKASQPTWETVRYMISVIQYGGRITDDFDQLLMDTYAEKYFHPGVLQVGLGGAALGRGVGRLCLWIPPGSRGGRGEEQPPSNASHVGQCHCWRFVNSVHKDMGQLSPCCCWHFLHGPLQPLPPLVTHRPV
jgi:hypothetical protein